jgi:hypothetical protein
MKTSLHKDLSSGGWHSSVMTTYSVDPSFFDSFIERQLRRSGCENNILLADAAMLTRALSSTPAAFHSAGRRYAIVPVNISGCFHPKVHLRFGRDKARLIIASANATAAGWCRNLEVLGDIDWDRRKDDQLHAPLIRKAYEYLMHWLRDASIEAIQYKCRMIERESPWLRDLPTHKEDIELPDGSRVNILCDRGGDSPSILRALVNRLAGERARKLVVVSPYWDTQLRGLRELRKALSDCETHIVLNPERSVFPVNALSSKDDVDFVALRTKADPRRFPHAKVILVETRSSDHVLFGSANCSDDALGLRTGPARNAEVCVYRRLPPGSVRHMLELDLKKKLPRKSIQQLPPSDNASDDESRAFNPGYMELAGRVILWYPPAGIDGVGATISIGAATGAVQASNGRLSANLQSVPPGVLVAHVTLRTGEVSGPVVVHDEYALRRAAPGQIDGRLRETFDRIRRGEEDLLDLAQYAHIIFAPEVVQQAQARSAAKGARGVRRDRKAVNYETPEQFRDAVSLEPATGSSGRFSVDDPGLLQVLAIVMRGVSGVGAHEESEALEREEDTHLEAGDSEDDEGSSEDVGQESDTEATRTVERSGKPWCFTPEEITRRRNRLKKTMDSFQELLDTLVADPSLVSSRVATQTAFMIQLMMLACTLPHQRQDGSNVRLMVFYPIHASDRECSFALRVARMLKALWIGDDSIAQHLALGASYQSLPDDIVAWIVLSRWAIARASLAGKGLPGILPSKIADVARGVYAATRRLGPVVPGAEVQMMRELDSKIGFSPEETADLKRYVEELSALSSRGREATSMTMVEI